MGDSADTISPKNFAERYESTLVPVIFIPWAREIIRRGEPRDGESILDLACGTGVVTRQLHAAGVKPGAMAGADINADMLAVAAKRAEDAGIEAEWAVTDAAQLPFEDNRFDVAFCQQALQFFPDRVAALRELRRVLAPDGRAVFCVSTALAENPLLHAQAAALEKHVGPDAGAAVRAICSLSDAGAIRADFEAAGFNRIDIDKVSLDLNHPDGRVFANGAMSGMHTGDKLKQSSEEKIRQCVDDFLAGMGDCFDGTAIRFPHVSHVIMARA